MTTSSSQSAVANFFKRLLGSRKMLLGVFGLATILVSFAGAVFSLVSIVAGLIAAEDSVKAWASRPTNWQQAVQDIIDDLRATFPDKPPSEGGGGAG